ncbi:RNA recognition motif [Trifolium medium]|uniref:RNA recognition motif n=1 Tax=Trifolium medium TaxID=97028 RepID=A0A392Q2B8_9FABA|nr:RNA recognition motif [Trifolium medium]
MREKEERGERVGGRANHRGYVHILDKEATTFFFTNFSEDVKAADLWLKFARYGRVGEVFISAKVDKQGKRFGFVKFREVQEAKELPRSISDIWMGSFKLRINLSKFNRRSESSYKGKEKKEVAETYLDKQNSDHQAHGGRSFKKAMLVDSDTTEEDARRVGA